MPPGIDLQQVWNQYGLFGVLLFFGGFALINMAKNRAATKDLTDKTASNVSAVLADNIGRLGEAILKMSAEASHERTENLMVIKDMTGQMKGMISVLDDTKKSQRGISDTVSEVADRIVPMQTDLKDISLRTAGMPSAFTNLLDERMAPILTLFIGMNTQVNAVAAAVQAISQNGDANTLEVVAVKDHLAKLVAEFSLLKDLFLDRDDRLSEHMKRILPAIQIPSQPKEFPTP